MSKNLLQIIDDTDSSLSYGGGTWSHSKDTQWYLKTETWAKFTENKTQTGNFSVKFKGTSIAIVGSTPGSAFPQTFRVSIDSGSATTVAYPAVQQYLKWYQSPTLQDGDHTLSVEGIQGDVGVDFAVVSVLQNTTLPGKTVAIDDDDPAVQYSGSWSRNTDQFMPGVLLVGTPFGGATHRSSQAGDTITFQFTGSAISVYGIFLWGNLGSLSMTYTIDGNSKSQTYTVTTQSPEYVANFKDTENFPYFSQGKLSNGNHTLVIQIVSSSNQTFILDYFTYTTLPTLSSIPSTNSSSSQGSSPSQTSIESDAGSRKSSPSIAGIAGGCIGGTLFVVLLFLFLFRRLRERRKGLRHSTSHHISSERQMDEHTNLHTNPNSPTRQPQQPSPVNPYSDSSRSGNSVLSPYLVTVPASLPPSSKQNLLSSSHDPPAARRSRTENEVPPTHLSSDDGSTLLSAGSVRDEQPPAYHK